MTFRKMQMLMAQADPGGGSPAPAPPVGDPKALAAAEAEAARKAAEAEGAEGGADENDESKLPENVRKKLKKQNQENESLRKRLREREEADKAAADKALAEQGEFRKLADSAGKERDALKAEVEEHRALTKSALDAEIASLSEDEVDLVPEYSDQKKLEWLRRFKARKAATPGATVPPRSITTAPTATKPPPGGQPNKPEHLTPQEIQELHTRWTKDERKAELRKKQAAYEAWAAEQ